MRIWARIVIIALMPFLMATYNPPILQATNVILSADSATSSATFVTLYSTTITTVGNTIVQVHGYLTGSNSSTVNTANQVRLVVNGVVVAHGTASLDGGSLSAANVPFTISIIGRSARLAAGTYTVSLQWATAGGQLRCNASTGTQGENSQFFVEEWAF